MTEYHQLVKLNNEGATLIKSGRFDAASAYLAHGVKVARSMWTSCGAVDVHAVKVEGRFPIDDLLPSRRPARSTLDSAGHDASSSSPSCTPSACNALDQEAQFLYKEPIFLPETSSWIPHTAISVAIIFNLALANHLTAIASKNDTLLLRAAQFYQLAHKMQNASQSTTSSLCLGMIVLNNLGNLQRALGDFQQAERYFFALASQLRRMAAEDRGEEDFYGADVMQLLSESAFRYFSVIRETCAAAA
jgi:tetratricopeptide (TPR) repeat protein